MLSAEPSRTSSCWQPELKGYCDPQDSCVKKRTNVNGTTQHVAFYPPLFIILFAHLEGGCCTLLSFRYTGMHLDEQMQGANKTALRLPDGFIDLVTPQLGIGSEA